MVTLVPVPRLGVTYREYSSHGDCGDHLGLVLPGNQNKMAILRMTQIHAGSSIKQQSKLESFRDGNKGLHWRKVFSWLI